MNEHKKPRGRKAHNDKDSILADTKNLLFISHPRTSYKRICTLRDAIADDWWQWLDWDVRRQCVVSKPEYNFRARLNEKYHLKLKRL